MNLIAFNMAYLLGVEEKVLARDYKREYQLTNKTKIYKNKYVNVEILRALSRLRQSVLRYHYLYDKNKTIDNITQGYLVEEIQELRKIGIYIEKVYKKLDLDEYLNFLTITVNNFKHIVLRELNLPQPNILEEYFNMPPMELDRIVEFAEKSDDLDKPHGLVLYRANQIKKSLVYTLSSDEMLFKNIYKILGKHFSDTVISLNKYKEMNLNSDTERLEYKKFQIDFKNKIESFIKEVSEKDDLSVVFNYKKDIKDISKVKVPDFKGEFASFLEKELEIFVDCDNTDFFKTLNFVRGLKNISKISAINLIVDKKSNFLWKKFNDIYKGEQEVNIIISERIKRNKSVADVVLTMEFSKAYYTRNLKRAVIISSDSDFYGLINSFDDVDFSVGYISDRINRDYLDYIKEQSIVSYDLEHLDTLELVAYYRRICLEYILCYVLGKTPINEWVVDKISEMVGFYFKKETNIIIEDDYIKDIVNELMGKARVLIEENTTYIQIEDVKVDTNIM